MTKLGKQTHLWASLPLEKKNDKHVYIDRLIGSIRIVQITYFFPWGHGNESCNLIGTKRGPDFSISDHSHGNGGKQRRWNGHVQLIFVSELAVFVDLFPFYTLIEDKSTQVYLYPLLNGKESHCKLIQLSQLNSKILFLR